METIPNDVLRQLLARHLPIYMIANLSKVCRRFCFLGTDEKLFASIALQYSPSLTNETKRSYSWKDIVRIIHAYQTKFSKTVHTRYGLRFRNYKTKLLNLEANIFTSFKYTGLMLDPDSIGKSWMIKMGRAKYCERVDILHFVDPKHDFLSQDVENLKPIYRPCLSNKAKKLLPPVEAFLQSHISELDTGYINLKEKEDVGLKNKLSKYNDYVSVLSQLDSCPQNFDPIKSTTLVRSGIVIFDKDHAVIAWEVDLFRQWIDRMVLECHQEMHRLYREANLLYAKPLYYKITGPDNGKIHLNKKVGDVKSYIMMAFRKSKKRVTMFKNLEIVSDDSGQLLLKANLNLEFLPFRKTDEYADYQSKEWCPIELCPVIKADGSCKSSLTRYEGKKNYLVVHPFDYFYGWELHGEYYRKPIKIDIPDNFRRNNKLPAVILFTPIDTIQK